MSRHWDPAWARPAVVVTGRVDAESFNANATAIEASLPEELRGWKPCPDQAGVTRHGVAGPDHSVLVPAALRGETVDLQRQIGRLTWYFICTRPRVTLDPSECFIRGGHLHLGFEVSLDDGENRLFRAVAPEPTTADQVEVTSGGETLILTNASGGRSEANASILAQHVVTPDPYQPSPFDLEIRYIGRARGDLAERCALDRLEAHGEYQAVLEETSKHPYRNREVVLLLCAGTTLNIGSFGDHEPTLAELKAEHAAIAQVRDGLTENVRVDAVEALLINLFKPTHNTHYVGPLDPRWKVFQKCNEAGLTGLTLVFSTDTLRCGLFTDAAAPAQHFHHTACFESQRAERP